MPGPVKIKNKSEAPGAAGCLFVVTLLAVVLVLALMWALGIPVHTGKPLLDRAVQALFIFIPFAAAGKFIKKPFEFMDNPGETPLALETYRGTLGRDWWMSALLWPPVPLALVILVREALPVPAPLPAFRALLNIVFAFAFSVFYINMLMYREPYIWTEEGVRAGMAHFAEWESIDHVALRDGVWHLVHKANPRLTLATFPISDSAVQARFRQELEKRGIPVRNQEPGALFAVKTVSGAATFLLMAAGFILYLKAGAGSRWSLVSTFGLCVLAVFMLERYRGIALVTMVKPVVEDVTLDAED
jgi:hypothetical protein